MDLPGFSKFFTLDEQTAPDCFRRVTNAELPLDGSEIQGSTHIESRLIAHGTQTIESLSVRVIEELLKSVRVEVGDIGGLVLATCYPGDPWEMAGDVARKIGMQGEVRGIDCACCGFVAGAALAREIALTVGKSVALVTTEILSRMINWEPPPSVFSDHRARGKAAKIFGDRTAVVLVKPPGFSASYDILDAYYTEFSDPHECLALIPVDDSIDIDGNTREGQTLCIDMPGRGGAYLKKDAPKVMADSTLESLKRARNSGFLREGKPELTDIAPHDANGVIVDEVRQHLIREGCNTTLRLWKCIAKAGNTSAVSIPAKMAMVHDEIPAGAVIAMPAVGAGSPGFKKGWLTRGAVLARKRG